MDHLDVVLPGDLALTQRLIELGQGLDREGLSLRIVGGLAMMVWKRALKLGAIDVTNDLDLAILASDLASEAEGQDFVNSLHSVLGSLGAQRPVDWRGSRSGRFKYRCDDQGSTEVDVLCGELSVGQASRKPPAWRVARLTEVLPGEAPHFYAGLVPWLDFVAEWVPVAARIAGDEVSFTVPCTPSMAVLKLKAVSDKIERVLQERDGPQRDHERRRLERHAAHLEDAVEMTDQLGQRDRLQAIKRAHPDVARTALEVERHLMEDTGLLDLHLGLETVRVLAD